MNKWSLLGLIASSLWLQQSLTSAQEFALVPNSSVQFVSAARAQEVLATQDDFIRALSPFDRAARMKSGSAPSEAEFLRFLASNTLEWEPAETNRLVKLLDQAGKGLVRWKLPFPARIELVKTTGQEEGKAAYTRGAAIILPRGKASEATLDLLLHELFHILSRFNPELRERLYRTIGFKTINEVPLPDMLESVRITNPDGVHHRSMILVRLGESAVPVVPILYSSAPRYDPVRGGEFFDYLVFRLMVLAETNGAYSARIAEGKPQLLNVKEVSGFYEQIGKNTGYILHPDEILADNFVMLVQGKTDLPSPQITAAIKQVLESGERSAPTP